jgi:hypothetical protein
MTSIVQQEKARFREVLLKEKNEIDRLLAALDGNSRYGAGDAMPLVEPPRRVRVRTMGQIAERYQRGVVSAAGAAIKNATLAEVAREILGDAGPLSTNELVEALTAKGKVPGGERPVATVYSTLVKAKGIKRKDGKWHKAKAEDGKATETGKRAKS